MSTKNDDDDDDVFIDINIEVFSIFQDVITTHRFECNRIFFDKGLLFDLRFFLFQYSFLHFKKIMCGCGWVRRFFEKKNVNIHFRWKIGFSSHDIITQYRNKIIKFPFNQFESGQKMNYIKCACRLELMYQQCQQEVIFFTSSAEKESASQSNSFISFLLFFSFIYSVVVPGSYVIAKECSCYGYGNKISLK